MDLDGTGYTQDSAVLYGAATADNFTETYEELIQDEYQDEADESEMIAEGTADIGVSQSGNAQGGHVCKWTFKDGKLCGKVCGQVFSHPGELACVLSV